MSLAEQISIKNSSQPRCWIDSPAQYTAANLIPATFWPNYQNYFNKPGVDPRYAGVRLCNRKMKCEYDPGTQINDGCYSPACSTIFPCDCNQKFRVKCNVGYRTI